MLNKVKGFTDSIEFNKALKVTIAVSLPAITFALMNEFYIGFTIALGVFLTYSGDVPSNLKYKIKGLLIAILIVTGSTAIVCLTYGKVWIFYPTFTALVFFLSMISIYGQQASLISFSGLIAVVLAFSKINTGIELLLHLGLLVCGGLFYMIISILFYYINPHKYTEKKIGECIKLTSRYLKLRASLWDSNINKTKVTERQLHFQVELNIIHEELREVLFRNRVKSGTSNRNRKLLLVFSNLVEILELAIATPFDHAKLNEKLANNTHILTTYQHLAYNLANALYEVSKGIENRNKNIRKYNLYKELKNLKELIDVSRPSLSEENLLSLYHVLHYAEKQIDKIRIISSIFTDIVNIKDFDRRYKEDLEKFLTPLQYSWNTFIENLSFSSIIFRHSLRLTLTVLIGYSIGYLLEFMALEKGYWILLTIVVIMRPNYGLTKKRSYERTLGTITGGTIAFVFISFIHDTTIISSLIIISILLGLSFTQKNYTVSATFVTIYVIFIYNILSPNVANVLEYRILDTIIGSILAIIANHFLWPSWEFLSLPLYMEKSITANRNYMKEISTYYNNKGEVTTSYRLSRKNAFVEIGNLISCFQRMVQEPRSKQKKLPKVYKFVALNHTILSSLASLGTFIQFHKTSSVPESFNSIINAIIKNLDYCVALLRDEIIITSEIENQFKEETKAEFHKLRSIYEKENELEQDKKNQESQLIIDQLTWLTNLSESILKATQELKKSDKR